MKKSRFTEDQIVRLLRQHQNKEKTADELCRDAGISQATFYAWKKKYGGMSVSEAKRLRQLEHENSRLKRLLAERSLELDLLQDALKKI
ncbi:MAG: transposase [Cyanobacteria bacterium HKST-UBA06]|nr:transposase [Cyanobacteria bacterium HKST-UBA05]MCA9808255.1 transposase [Cyanobacteria bacterium HKST-UBA06]